MEGRGRLDGTIEKHHLTVRRRLRYATLGAGGTPEEIWYLLHGYGQLAHRFLRHFRSLADGRRLLVAPEGLHRHYLDRAETKVGASWMTSEDRLTDIGDYVAYLDRLATEVEGGAVKEGRGTRPPRRIGLGFSQGVHTLSRWLAFGGTALEGAVFWGASLPPDLELADHAERLGTSRLLLVAGEADALFPSERVRQAEERLGAAGLSFRTVRYAGGHGIEAGPLERVVAALDDEAGGRGGRAAAPPV